jgi:predicted transport protein
MPLFKFSKGKLQPINFSKLKNEKELQKLVETNLEDIFGLKFIETEFRVHPFRIDTFAFDPESKAIVIIEYKESEDYSVIDQGYSYLNLLLSHKGDFHLALERKLNKRVNVDWSQSRIIFIAKSFNAYQLGALSQNLPFELWKYTYYQEEIISFEQLKPMFAQISGLPVGKIAKKVEREIRVYTLEDHLGKRNSTIRSIYSKLQQAIFNLNPEIREKIKKKYIAYELKSNFAEFVIQSSAVKVYLDIPINELHDPSKIAEDCSSVGHWGTGDTRFKIRSIDDVPYAVELIKQSYERNQNLKFTR